MISSQLYPQSKKKTLKPSLSHILNVIAQKGLMRDLMSHLDGLEKWVLTNLWIAKARPDQLPPFQEVFAVWVQLGGRGAGKTRAGAEWVRALVRNGVKRVALVAATYHDAREVMIHGESGLANIGPQDERPDYVPSRRTLNWPNGAIGQVFSAEEPDRLRGPQFEAAWADEFCAWEYPEETLSNLRLATRLGDNPQIAVTTTPKNTRALRKLLKTPGTVVSRSKTSDNRENLAPQFLEFIQDAYGGTRLARQELDGELLTDMEGALWTRDKLETCHADDVPQLDKVIIAVDPPAGSKATSDACGIIVAGIAGEGRLAKVYVLEDATVQGRAPEAWAARVAALYEAYDASYVVAEVNQGGDMVEAVLGSAGSHVPVRTVFASKSKKVRAEPVSMLYGQGRVKHCGAFSTLEDELCELGTPGNPQSPDRADALVWAVSDLLLTRAPNPQIRALW